MDLKNNIIIYNASLSRLNLIIQTFLLLWLETQTVITRISKLLNKNFEIVIFIQNYNQQFGVSRIVGTVIEYKIDIYNIIHFLYFKD